MLSLNVIILLRGNNRCYSWLAGFSGERVIYSFLLGVFYSFPSKRVIWVLSIIDYLIVLITNTSHKAYLLSCALRCSSKLQKIQSLENFVSMAIQSTQVPMYTKHTLFLYFSDFSIFFNKNKNKTKLKASKQKHVKQSIT